MREQKVYFALCVAANGADMGAIKIGCTYDIPRRMTALESLVPFSCEIVAEAPGDMFVENAVQMWFRAERISGEYFYATDRVMDFIDEVKRKGCIPLGIVLDGDEPFPWMEMAKAKAFMDRFGITPSDISEVSGSSLKTVTTHLANADRPNRRFAAAMTVAALSRGHTVNWPSDYYPQTRARKSQRETA